MERLSYIDPRNSILTFVDLDAFDHYVVEKNYDARLISMRDSSACYGAFNYRGDVKAVIHVIMC